MPHQGIEVVNMGEIVDLVRGGRFGRFMRAEFMVDGLGPFTVQMRLEEFSGPAMRQLIEAKAEEIRSVR